jgi:hypothetical protein
VALLPDDARKNLDKLTEGTLQTWLQRYPHDPLVHGLMADHMIEAHDIDGAERELRAALVEKDVLDMYYSNRKLEAVLRPMLARILLDSQRGGEAHDVMKPVCQMSDPSVEKLLDQAPYVCD